MTYYDPTAEEHISRRDALKPFDHWNERALLAVWALFGKPETYVDWGSGSGGMVRFARASGVDAIGLDVIAEEPDIKHDLRFPIDLGRKFQLATSIEVAEHLPEENAAIFCRNIADHLITDGGFLVFTAALPGQPGDNHVNCQPPHYWQAQFVEAGLTYLSEVTNALALLWRITTGPMHHLPANLQVFVKGGLS